MAPPAWRSVGPTVYPRLDLTGVRLPSTVLTGTRGRVDMIATARDLGYPQRTVTPALTRFSRVYVLQLDGDPAAGTVTLATGDGQAVMVKLPVDFRHRVVPPTAVETMLAAIAADYPPGSLTAALAESLSAVLHVCDRQRAHRTRHGGAARGDRSPRPAPVRPARPVDRQRVHACPCSADPVKGDQMSSTPPRPSGTGVPTPPDEPVTVVCAATYYADLHDAYAYVFRVPSTRTRFTIYSADGYRFSIGESYLLSLTPTSGTGAAPLASAPDPDDAGGGPAASRP